MRKTGQELIRRLEALKQERSALDETLDLIERFIRPGRGRMWSTAASENEIDWRRGREVYDSTAISAASFLAANMQSYLSSPSTPWYSIGFQDKELQKNREARLWIEESTKVHRAAYAESNLYEELPETYMDGVTSCTAILDHREKAPPSGRSPAVWRGHLFRTEPMAGTYFEEDIDGSMIGLYKVRHYTPDQLALKFGVSALPKRVLDKVGKAEQETHECLYAVYLNHDNVGADTTKPLVEDARPYVGQWVLCASAEMLGEPEGHYEMPAYAWRWARQSDSRFGHGPGIIALPDVLTLNDMVWLRRTAREKVIDPPTKSTRRGVVGAIDHSPGANTVVRDINQPQPLMPPQAYRIDEATDEIRDLRMSIERVFFVDQLRLRESPEMTALEVSVRYEIMQRLLGPNVGRARTDLFDRMHRRSFWMLYRKGVIAPMPQVVREAGPDLDISYIGPLAKVERAEGVEPLRRWLGLLAGFGEGPGAEELGDVPDYEKIARDSADMLGVPTEWLRSQTAVAKRREGRARQQATAMAAEQAAQLGQAASGFARGGPPAGAQGPAMPPGSAPGEPPR